MSAHAAPIEGTIWTRPFKTLTFLAGLGVLLVLLRYALGLGATTALNDGYPWGIWIAFDVVTGTALGCGGYSIAILLYVLNKGRYHPLVRPAILTSMLGYTLAGLAIAVDVGRYWNIFLVPIFFWDWNLHSALLEVALCIMAYVGVLWIEMAAPIMEAWQAGRSPRLRRIAARALPWLNRYMVFIVAAALLLPTMHQSSLGTVMMLAGHKLDPLWQTPLLPLLFLISVIGMGFAVVVFESTLSSWLLGRPFETKMLGGLVRIVSWITFGYLLLRFGDLVVRGALPRTISSGWLSFCFWLETMLFLVPALMSLSARVRANPGRLFQLAMMFLLGGALYRFDTYLVGFTSAPGANYFPSITELFVTVGFISAEIMAYIYFVKRFPILAATGRAQHREAHA